MFFVLPLLYLQLTDHTQVISKSCWGYLCNVFQWDDSFCPQPYHWRLVYESASSLGTCLSSIHYSCCWKLINFNTFHYVDPLLESIWPLSLAPRIGAKSVLGWHKPAFQPHCVSLSHWLYLPQPYLPKLIY